MKRGFVQGIGKIWNEGEEGLGWCGKLGGMCTKDEIGSEVGIKIEPGMVIRLVAFMVSNIET